MSNVSQPQFDTDLAAYIAKVGAYVTAVGAYVASVVAAAPNLATEDAEVGTASTNLATAQAALPTPPVAPPATQTVRNGLAAGPLPPDLSFGAEITSACSMPPTFSPLVAYAIKWNETADLPNAATIVSADGGHGLFQLTASYPPNWDAPYVNALYAITDYLFPAETYWADQAQGDDLVRCIAAEFNAGRAQAIKGHDAGDIDAHTTNHYAARALATYQRLLAGKSPE